MKHLFISRMGFIFLILVVLSVSAFAEESTLISLIKDRQNLDAETKSIMESYIQGFSISSVRYEEEKIIIEGTYTTKRWDTKSDYGGKVGQIYILKSGNQGPGGIHNSMLSERIEEVDGGWYTFTDFSFIYTEDFKEEGKFSYSYDIAQICTFWNSVGNTSDHLIGYDTITVSGKKKKVKIEGFTPEKKKTDEDKTAQNDTKNDNGAQNMEAENKDGVLPAFLYRKIEKTVEYYNFIKGRSAKAKRIYKTILENVIIKVAAGQEVKTALKAEYKNFWDQIDQEDIDYNKLIMSSWQTKTVVDYKLKNAAMTAVDTYFTGGLLDSVDTLVTGVFSKDKNSPGYVKKMLYDKDELEYRQVQTIEDDLDVDETEAVSYLHIAKPKDESLLRKTVNAVPFGKLASKGARKVYKGVSKLLGFFEEEKTKSEKEVARWAGNTYRFVGAKVAKKILNGTEREQAIAEVKSEFMNSETLADQDFIEHSKYDSAEGCFNGFIGLMEKNGVFERMNKGNKG